MSSESDSVVYLIAASLAEDMSQGGAAAARACIDL